MPAWPRPRRAKPIREAAIVSAKQLPNPEFSFEITRDTPHETVGFGLPFELGGKRARRIDLAREEQSLADLEVRGALQSLRGELRRSFYGLLAAEERVSLADEVEAIARRVREAAQARLDEGIAPRLDVLEAELGLARATADFELERSNRIPAAAALNAVLNRPPGQPVAVSGDLSSGPPPLDAAQAWELASAANLESSAPPGDRHRGPPGRPAAGRTHPHPGPPGRGGAERPRRIQLRSVRRAVRRHPPLLPQPRRDRPIHGDGAAARVPARSGRSLGRKLRLRGDGELEALRRQVAAYAKTFVPTAISIESWPKKLQARPGPLLSVLEAQRTLRDVRREYLQALADFQSAVAELEEIIGEPIQDK